MPILILILTLLLTGGCAAVNRLDTRTADTATTLFIQGVHEVAEGGKSPAFETLRKDYPDSPWNAEARALLDMMKEQSQRLAKLQQDKTRCRRDYDQLMQKNNQLQADQEKLKNLMIEIEKRTK
ncbi:hypothetical protein DSOUD_2708 [Desulfuromonas soudanensis]|uniref:Uncharacterized protein n=1 Tax=Desulfuromonas soudanensis TaxID=1603606 RepID=A0A0M4D2Z6_9BACT|nr:hypothetical protein [Desulfuromonas soudanensis]ALC17458.1 hypothetical protein DSOUD_2708 [Desulfuromonas soudanensis]